MVEEDKTNPICYLCGRNIETSNLSDDHVPPKAFYPKGIRAGLNLWVIPSHKTCNEIYREDEEYFQHAFLIEVLNQKPPITKHLMSDFHRRSQRPQTPALLRKILKEVSNITPGGIYLPNRIRQVQIDKYRIQRVVLKIVRGLFYIDNRSFLPLEKAKDIRFYSNNSDAPELYRLYWPYVKLRCVCPDVFSYKYFKFDNLHLYSLMFWETVMFCVAFENPEKN